MNDSKKIEDSQFWNDDYLLNIPIIDNQHQKFFLLFDKLYFLNNDENQFEELKVVIDELDSYTVNHFNVEEEFMKKAKSPDIDNHIAQHIIFKDKIENFRTAYKYKNSVLMNEMINFMRKWFLLHIMEIDKHYVDTVKTYLNTESNK